MREIWRFDRYKNRTAVIDEFGASLSYDQLNKEASILANHMEKRCVVICLCSNTIGSILGYVSFLNNGIVPIMLSSDIGSGLLYNLIDLYRPTYLWRPKGVGVDSKDYKIICESYGYELVKTGHPVSDSIYSQLAILLSTSGSTGSPKFVRQSYQNIISNTKSIIEYLELDSNERPITTLPMNYTYGLSIINTHLAVGATMLITQKGLMQKEFWNFFREQRATSFGGVPYTYEMLEKLRFFRMELPALKTMTQAGGKLTPELHEKFARFAEENNKRFIVMYGQCEATARMGYLPAEKAVEKKGSMGIAIPGGRFRLIGADGDEVQTAHTTGELVYEGANVTLGYAESIHDLAKGDERNGILETGDMAEYDEDGYYYIVGRKKRFLKIYGNRVNLDEMDRLIKGKFGIEAACAGFDDHMYIFLTDESKDKDVKEYVARTTKLNPAAFKIIIIDEIPKNDSGKTMYKELENYYDV